MRVFCGQHRVSNSKAIHTFSMREQQQLRTPPPPPAATALFDHLLPSSQLNNSQLPQPCAQKHWPEVHLNPMGPHYSQSPLTASQHDAGTRYYFSLISVTDI